jgi:hypothetical protein
MIVVPNKMKALSTKAASKVLSFSTSRPTIMERELSSASTASTVTEAGDSQVTLAVSEMPAVTMRTYSRDGNGDVEVPMTDVLAETPAYGMRPQITPSEARPQTEKKKRSWLKSSAFMMFF